MRYACCAALALLAGCGQRFSNANLKVINQEWERSDQIMQAGGKDDGVTTKEVESVLGPPMKAETSKMALETQKKELELVRYYYQQGDQIIEFHFLDNKLISKVPLLRETGPATPEPKAEGEQAPAEQKP